MPAGTDGQEARAGEGAQALDAEEIRRRQMLSIVEEIILVALEENSGSIAPEMRGRQFDFVLAGAVLIDLALQDRIDTDPDRLILIDSTPTGDVLLDPTLAMIAASEDQKDTAWWAGETAKSGETIRETAVEHLLLSGIIEADTAFEGAFVLSARVSRSRRYPTVDGAAVEEVRLRIVRTLFDEDIPDPRDIALICLIDAGNLLSSVLSRQEMEEVRERIDLIRKMDLIGRTVAAAVETMVAEAAPPPALQIRPWTEIPGPRQLPLIGNLADLARDRRAFLVEQYRAFGPIFRIRVARSDLIVLAGPEANRFVARGNRHFRNMDMWSSFHSHFDVSRSMLTMDGHEHLRIRRDHVGVYSLQLIESRIPEACRIAEREILEWQTGRSLPGFRACQRIIAEQISVLALGLSARDCIDDIIRCSNTAMSALVSRHMPAVALKLPRYRRSRARVEAFIRNVLNAHSPDRRKGQPADFVDHLIELNAGDPHYISETDLKIYLLGPLIAGLDTAASACAFMLYELLKNSDLLERATGEADRLFRNQAPGVADVRQLDVIRRSMMETLRRYPLSVVTYRRVANSFEFQGYAVPAGAHVLIAFTLPHMMEEYWSNPMEFDIDRFAKGRQEHSKTPGVYEPFGVGAHSCLGRSLAELLMMIDVASILHHFELRLDPPGYRLKVREYPGLHPRPSLRFFIAGRRAGE